MAKMIKAYVSTLSLFIIWMRSTEDLTKENTSIEIYVQ